MKAQPAWRPTPEYVENAQLTRFLRFCACATFEEMHSRSVSEIAWFTERVLEFLEIRWRQR